MYARARVRAPGRACRQCVSIRPGLWRKRAGRSFRRGGCRYGMARLLRRSAVAAPDFNGPASQPRPARGGAERPGGACAIPHRAGQPAARCRHRGAGHCAASAWRPDAKRPIGHQPHIPGGRLDPGLGTGLVRPHPQPERPGAATVPGAGRDPHGNPAVADRRDRQRLPDAARRPGTARADAFHTGGAAGFVQPYPPELRSGRGHRTGPQPGRNRPAHGRAQSVGVHATGGAGSQCADAAGGPRPCPTM
jgi:hypothetical protein